MTFYEIIIIGMEKLGADKLIEAFPPPDFYLDKESILDGIDTQSMFSLIDLKGGGKVDFRLLTNDPFDQSRFSRRYVEEFKGLKMRVSSPEDTILAKLRWAKLSGGSEKQFIDALRVYEVQYGKLDSDYLEHWSRKLDVESLWKSLIEEAEVE